MLKRSCVLRDLHNPRVGLKSSGMATIPLDVEGACQPVTMAVTSGPAGLPTPSLSGRGSARVRRSSLFARTHLDETR